MRLIDADTEIKKIEEEIKRSYKAIDRWRSRRMPGSRMYGVQKRQKTKADTVVKAKDIVTKEEYGERSRYYWNR